MKQNVHSTSTRLSAALQVEASVEIQFRDAETFRLTLWGLRNHHYLHLQLPEEEEEEDKSWNMEEAGAELKAFYSCWPAPVSPESTAQSQCLLWLSKSNQTSLRGAAHNQPPPAEKGRCWPPGRRTEKQHCFHPAEDQQTSLAAVLQTFHHPTLLIFSFLSLTFPLPSSLRPPLRCVVALRASFCPGHC